MANETWTTFSKHHSNKKINLKKNQKSAQYWLNEVTNISEQFFCSRLPINRREYLRIYKPRIVYQNVSWSFPWVFLIPWHCHAEIGTKTTFNFQIKSSSNIRYNYQETCTNNIANKLHIQMRYHYLIFFVSPYKIKRLNTDSESVKLSGLKSVDDKVKVESIEEHSG